MFYETCASLSNDMKHLRKSYFQMSITYTRSIPQLILSTRHCLQRISSFPDGCCRCFTLVYMCVPLFFYFIPRLQIHQQQGSSLFFAISDIHANPTAIMRSIVTKSYTSGNFIHLRAWHVRQQQQF
jgi:hypothetical protein